MTPLDALALLPLLAVWFVPPLLLAFVCQLWLLRHLGIWQQHKQPCIFALMVNWLVAPIISLLLLRHPTMRVLEVSDNWLYFPLAWIVAITFSLLSSALIYLYYRE